MLLVEFLYDRLVCSSGGVCLCRYLKGVHRIHPFSQAPALNIRRTLPCSVHLVFT